MDGYHTDMIARTGAPDMTSFFFHSILSSPYCLACAELACCRCRVLIFPTTIYNNRKLSNFLTLGHNLFFSLSFPLGTVHLSCILYQLERGRKKERKKERKKKQLKTVTKDG